ncbi:MAG: hypothetical protein M0D57_10195 [Sphingobacteriales bacterium JAD_PAG50586_3]|nr:MAG: hypothetical protein M0D57_10195 [Sphingobacteriales bacterium JAD_PAG50586_3]
MINKAQKPLYKRLWFRVMVALGLGIALFLAFKVPILQAVSNNLRSEDEPVKTRYLFVLSGGAYDRAHEAARLYKAGLVDTLVCTGENVEKT